MNRYAVFVTPFTSPGSQPLSSELSLPSGSRLPDNRRLCSASLAAFTTISSSPRADVWAWYRLASRDTGSNGLMSPFPFFGSPVVHGPMPAVLTILMPRQFLYLSGQALVR